MDKPILHRVLVAFDGSVYEIATERLPDHVRDRCPVAGRRPQGFERGRTEDASSLAAYFASQAERRPRARPPRSSAAAESATAMLADVAHRLLAA